MAHFVHLPRLKRFVNLEHIVEIVSFDGKEGVFGKIVLSNHEEIQVTNLKDFQRLVQAAATSERFSALSFDALNRSEMKAREEETRVENRRGIERRSEGPLDGSADKLS